MWLVSANECLEYYVVDEMRKKKNKKKEKKKKKNNNHNMEGWFAEHEIQSTRTLHTKRFSVTLCIYILYQPAR